jgi:FixJ family two-component response regulator
VPVTLTREIRPIMNLHRPSRPQPSDAVYIVDDDASVRKQVARLVRSAGLEPFCFASAELFLQRADLRRPACLLLDVSMPGKDGLAVQDELRRRGQAMPIVFVSGHGSVHIATRAMKSGAMDFIEKPFQADHLLQLVQDAIERDRGQCADDAVRADVSARYATLTPREREVMGYVIRGFLNKQTAAELGISETTIKIHRGRVMEKMRAESVPELIHMAQQIGVCEPAVASAAAR